MRILIIFFLSLLFFSCEEEDICVEGSTPRLFIENVNSISDTILVDSIKVYRVNSSEELLVYQSSTLDEFKVPLNLEESKNTSFRINTYIDDKNYTDQLAIDYNYNLVFVSKACGFRVQYDSIQASLTPDFFKRVEVLNNSIDNEAEAHLRMSY